GGFLPRGRPASGVAEPRLVRLARQLAASGVAIVTPDIPELSRFDIAPAITDAIEDAGGWLASDAALAPDRRVGLMGISFSGGLSVVAAGRPPLAGRVADVFSLGGGDPPPRRPPPFLTRGGARAAARAQLRSLPRGPPPLPL